ncbi:MAG: hypothetical protein WDN75_03155 [Bacteroidota bacterium]
MKIRPWYGFMLMSALLTFCAGLFSTGAFAIASPGPLKEHGVNTLAVKINSKFFIDQSNDREANGETSQPVLRTVPDLVINASVLHIIDHILSKPELPYVAFKVKYALKVEPSRQLSLLKILFRSAISVNAP